jgi:beta-lactam-binding protein with PASTA domain
VTQADQFTYTACTVPKLKGKKLKAAKKALAKADCKLGKVKKLKGATTKTGKVKKQSPKPGTILAPGAKVRVKLG